MLVYTAMKNAINGIKLCLSFSPGLKFQVVYFKKCSSFWGTPSPDSLPGLRPWTPLGIEVPQWGPVVSAPQTPWFAPTPPSRSAPTSFKQDNALAHRARQTVELFRREKAESLLMTCGCSTSRILNRLITEFGDWCRNESTKRQHRALRAAAKVDEHLGWLPTECNRQINWSVSKETRCLCSYTRRSLWTVACRMFCDCIKHVQSVTFLTSLFCCKLLKYDLRIWQGNVVTVLRWGGQNWKHFRTLHVTSYENRLKCQELFKLKRVTFSWNTV